MDKDIDLYTPFSNFIVRLPLMPIEFYNGLLQSTDTNKIEDYILDKELPIRNAINLANYRLLTNITELRKLNNDKYKKVTDSLLRYLIRMSTRTTPFGLFASVGVGRWSNKTSMSFSIKNRFINARVDTELLARLAMKLEQDEFVMEQLKLFTNPTIVMSGSRAYILQHATIEKRLEREVSINTTKLVRDIFALCGTGATYIRVEKSLIKKYKTDKDQIKKTLRALISQSFLFTSLRPSLEEDSYIDRIVAHLPKSKMKSDLENISEKVKELDMIGLEEIGDKQDKIVEEIRKIGDIEVRSPLHVDTGIKNENMRLNKAIGEKGAQAAEILLSLSTYPNGSVYLQQYKKKFVERYGDWAIVSLLDLFDQAKGLGSPYNKKPVINSDNLNNSERHDDILMNLVIQSIKQRKLSICLDDSTLERLKVSDLGYANAPKSLDLYASVCALSEDDIDKGNFKLLISQVTGKIGAGESITRFSHLLTQYLKPLFDEISDYEQLANGNILISEAYAIPENLHTLNISLHEPFYNNSIALGIVSGKGSEIIPMNDIYIGLRYNNFYIYWAKRKKEILVKSNSMLNYKYFPDIIRFLIDASESKYPVLHQFDWKNAGRMPFLPRIEYNNIILSPARWNINSFTFEKSDLNDLKSFSKTLEKWRQEWLVPEKVFIRFMDNRLLIDMKTDKHVELLYSSLKKNYNKTTILEEMLPTTDQSWVSSDNGHYISEVVIPLRLKKIRKLECYNKNEKSTLVAYNSNDLKKLESDKLKTVGSDWLYIKLYVTKNVEIDVITHSIRELCVEYMDQKLIRNWFFVRYADPRYQLRIRFNGNPKTLTDVVMPRLSEWAKKLVDQSLCFGFCIDNYEREIERYGGSEGIDVAEKVFGFDSNIAIFALWSIKDKDSEVDSIYAIAAITADYIMCGLGLDINKRLALYRKWVRGVVNKPYANFRLELRNLTMLLEGSINPRIRDIKIKELKRMVEDNLSDTKIELDKLNREGKLCQNIEDIYRSYIHMHFNRLLGINNDEENFTLILLKKSLETIFYKNMVK